MTLMGDSKQTTRSEQAPDATAEELAWGHGLFDGTRGETEPSWAVDLGVIRRAGSRRRRVRRVRAGSGVLAVLAVTAAAAVTLGAGTTDYGSAPGPGGGWHGRPLQDVFTYVEPDGGSFEGNDGNLWIHVPKSAAVGLAAMLGHLDPGGTHLGGVHGDLGTVPPRIIGDGDSWLKGARTLLLSSTWTADGTGATRARLSYEYFDDVNSLRASTGDGTHSGPCGLAVDGYLNPRDPSAKTPPLQWSSCRYTELPDGSRVGTASAAFGAATETGAVRIFPAGNVVALVGYNYPTLVSAAHPVPSAADVVNPSPWSENGLAAALSDPAVGPVLAPVPPPNADGRLLVPADVGSDWAYDLSGGETSTGEFVMDNGCDPDHSVFGLAAGRAVGYTGSLPDGTQGTGFEGEYRLPAGTGAKTMQDARTYSRGGCDPASMSKDGGGYSQDTVTDLPAGIGDGAFVENQPQQGAVRVTVRIGDTILQTDITRTDHARLTLASDADRAWLRQIAVTMAARYTGAEKAG